ncbi:MAG TPA: hypothetical protein VIO11_10745 [Candidatus Methanoperedens sp.]
MKYDKIKIPEGRKIKPEIEFGSVKIDVMNGGRIFPINHETLAGNTFHDRERKMGHAQIIPEISRDWVSWRNVGEIDIERVRYLHNTDDLTEEMLKKS